MKQDLDLRYWQARYREYIEIVRGWSQRTVEIYTGELKGFFAYLERQGVTQLGRLSRSHLEGYRLEIFQQRRQGKPLAKSHPASAADRDQAVCALSVSRELLAAGPGRGF